MNNNNIFKNHLLKNVQGIIYNICIYKAWMNEQTIFYEGSGEDSGSFYIQPSPKREAKDTMGSWHDKWGAV